MVAVAPAHCHAAAHNLAVAARRLAPSQARWGQRTRVGRWSQEDPADRIGRERRPRQCRTSPSLLRMAAVAYAGSSGSSRCRPPMTTVKDNSICARPNASSINWTCRYNYERRGHYLAAIMTSPNTTANTVIPMSRVRRENRPANVQGITAIKASTSTTAACGTDADVV
jgi:hypothetical protein